MDTAVGFKTLTVIGLSLWRSDMIAAGGGLDKGLKFCNKTAGGGLDVKTFLWKLLSGIRKERIKNFITKNVVYICVCCCVAICKLSG